jgi:hypothetical protein
MTKASSERGVDFMPNVGHEIRNEPIKETRLLGGFISSIQHSNRAE